MKVKVNNSVYTIYENSKEQLNDICPTSGSQINFGLTNFGTQAIHLNKELVHNQKMATLKHELCHAWLWEHAHTRVAFDCEDVCDLVSAMSEFVADTSRKYSEKVSDKNGSK